MKLKISLKWSLIILGIGGITLSSIMIFFPALDPEHGRRINPEFTEPVSPTRLAEAPAKRASSQTSQNLIDGTSVEPRLRRSVAGQVGRPIRLKIPKINVDAAVEYVGITPDGAMDVPKGPADVAWFNLGPRPGENGSAVMAGHYGWKNNISSVFDDLHTLQKGDKLYVEDEKGAITTFVVRESRRYDPKADASNVFIPNDSLAHLNLITCEGIWDKVSESYSERLVVFTDKEME